MDEAGTYRFDVDTEARVDLASNGRMAYPSDHDALTNCSGIHEYVESRLARGAFLLQLSTEHARSLNVLAMRVDSCRRAGCCNGFVPAAWHNRRCA